jgi:hypothetical protein
MKKAFAKYLLSTSIMLLGLVLTATGCFSLSSSAFFTQSATAFSEQHISCSTAQEVITTNPDSGLDVHFDLLVEETEVEENEAETDEYHSVAQAFLAASINDWLAQYLSSLQSTLVKQSLDGHVSSSPIFIIFRVLRL